MCVEVSLDKKGEQVYLNSFKWIEMTIYIMDNKKGCGQGMTAQWQWDQRGHGKCGNKLNKLS